MDGPLQSGLENNILGSMFVISLPVFFTLLTTCQCRTELQESPRKFGIELLYHIAEETQWHTAISPLGIWSLLTTLYIGATGNSRDQLVNTLNLPMDSSTVVSEYKNFINSVISQSSPDVQLNWNNFLFLDSDFTVEEEFDNTIMNDFDAKMTRIDFKSPSEAADYANSIIQESDASISNVFQPDDFNDARMILTNTISFKGLWQFPFNATDTQEKDFYDETGNVIGKVNMMEQEGSFSYSNIQTISAFALELPYGDTKQYSFLAILPHPDVKLTDVLNGMESFTILDILNQMQKDTEEFDLATVGVNLPRFKINNKIVLNTPLSSMGLRDIFDAQMASFESISQTESLYVTTIVHNANIEVTETGTKAAADTSSFISNRFLGSNFNANRPFLYFIIEKSTATIIFSGVYSIPVIY